MTPKTPLQCERASLVRPTVISDLMPGAHHIIAVQPALTERAADVIAHAGDDAEDAVAMREGEPGATDGDFRSYARGTPHNCRPTGPDRAGRRRDCTRRR